MPLIRKLIKVGNSKAVIIPADWIEYYQGKTGKPITEVLLEVNNIITVAIPEPDYPTKENNEKPT